MDEFVEAQAGLRKPNGFKAWWQTIDMTDEQRQSLFAAGQNPDISHRAIHLVLKRWGFDVTVASVGHWRRTHLGMLLR